MSKVTTARRLLAVSSVLAVALGATAGCNRSGGGGSGGTTNVGYSALELSEIFQVTQSKLFNAQAKKLGLSVNQANANRSAQTQLSQIRSMIQAGAKGLVVNPSDAKAIVPAISYANTKKVPVVVMDSGVAGKVNVYMVVKADNRDMAAKACQAVAKAIGGTGEVMMVDGDLTNQDGLDRQQGFADCMKKSYPKITVYDKVANWLPQNAANAVQTVMTEHPNVKAIYMATDTLYATPIWSALKRLGKAKPVGSPGHIFLASIDGSPTGLAAIRARELDVSIQQPVDQYAEWAAKYVQQGIKGMKQKPGETSHGPVRDVDGLLTNFIPSTAVTLKNVTDPKLWANQAATS